MQPLSSQLIREIDRRVIHELGIPGHLLMENAGAAVAQVARKLLLEFHLNKVAIICGQGNNGGDGFVAARHLLDKNIDLKVFCLTQFDQYQGDARFHLQLLQKCPILIETCSKTEPIRRFATGAPLLFIDAIFGTGLTRPVEGLSRETIEFMNVSKQPILAVDIPSGLDANSGQILGACVRAHTTVTFVRPKIGFNVARGPEVTGHIITTSIGIPEHFIEQWTANT